MYAKRTNVLCLDALIKKKKKKEKVISNWFTLPAVCELKQASYVYNNQLNTTLNVITFI